MDKRLMLLLVVLNSKDILSIPLPLSYNRQTGTGTLSKKFFPKETGLFRTRDDSKPYYWSENDLRSSGNQANRHGNLMNSRVDADNKMRATEMEIDLQLLRDVAKWEKRLHDNHQEKDERQNNKREPYPQRCLAGYMYCINSNDEDEKREEYSSDMEPSMEEATRLDEGSMRQHELEVEKALKQLELELHGQR